MIAGIIKLVSVLEQIQSIWSLVAGQVVTDNKLAGTSLYPLGDTIEWFQNTLSPYSSIQPVTTKDKPIGRIASTYYKSNTTWGNGQIYTGVNITSDWIFGGKNYKGEIVYVRSSDAGIPEKNVPTQGNSNMGLWIAGGLLSAYLLFGDSKKK